MGCRLQNGVLTSPSALQIANTLQINASVHWAVECNPGIPTDPSQCNLSIRAGVYFYPNGYTGQGQLQGSARIIDTYELECTSSYNRGANSIFTVDQGGYYSIRFEIIDSSSMAVLTFAIAYVWVVPAGSGGGGT